MPFILLLLLSGCGSGFKLLTDNSPKVIDRSTGKECKRVWVGFTDTHSEEAFDCGVVLRYEDILLYDRQNKSFVRKRKLQ